MKCACSRVDVRHGAARLALSAQACWVSPPLLTHHLTSPLLPPAAIAMRQPDQRGAALNRTILTQHRRFGFCVKRSDYAAVQPPAHVDPLAPRSLGLVGYAGALVTHCCCCCHAHHRRVDCFKIRSGQWGALYALLSPPPHVSIQRLAGPHANPRTCRVASRDCGRPLRMFRSNSVAIS